MARRCSPMAARATTLLALLCAPRGGAADSWPFFPYYGPSALGTTSDWPHMCDPAQFYALDYSQTYSRDRKLPQSCKCKESGKAESECTLFECECVCDLTAGACDLDCCCDAECTDAQVQRFSDRGSCLPEGPPDAFVTQCYSADKLDAVNPAFPMTGKATAGEALDDLLCVEYDNSAHQGSFYADPGTPNGGELNPGSVFAESRGAKAYEYSDFLDVTEGGALDAADVNDPGLYTRGAPLRAAFVDSATGLRVAAYGGALPLPSAAHDGTCAEGSSAEFAHAVGLENTCTRVLPDLAGQCAAVLGADRFAALHVGATTTAALATDAADDPDGWVAIEVRSVKWKDPYTGELFAYDGYNCSAYYEGPEPIDCLSTLFRALFVRGVGSAGNLGRHQRCQ